MHAHSRPEEKWPLQIFTFPAPSLQLNVTNGSAVSSVLQNMGTTVDATCLVNVAVVLVLTLWPSRRWPMGGPISAPGGPRRNRLMSSKQQGGRLNEYSVSPISLLAARVPSTLLDGRLGSRRYSAFVDPSVRECWGGAEESERARDLPTTQNRERQGARGTLACDCPATRSSSWPMLVARGNDRSDGEIH